MRILDYPQGTPEWLQARAGKITASRMRDIMASIKSGEAAARRNYRAELVVETLTGLPYEDYFQTPDMLRGKELEPEARAAYEAVTLQTVQQVGLVLHPKIDRIAASPDGLVGEYGLVELKVPKTGTHLEYIQLGVVPSEYRYQMMTQMLCCERDWCDFCSYDPRMPVEYQLFIIRFHRDVKDILLMETAAMGFLKEVDETLSNLKQRPVFIGL
jgi:putative phage-type endonuclease